MSSSQSQSGDKPHCKVVKPEASELPKQTLREEKLIKAPLLPEPSSSSVLESNTSASLSQSHLHPIQLGIKATVSSSCVDQQAVSRVEFEIPSDLVQHSLESSIISSKTKMTKCRFFFSERGCAKGEMCSFSHDVTEDQPTADAVQPNRTIRGGNNTRSTTRPICKFFASGFCKWGNRCGFMHSRPTTGNQVNGPKSTNHSKKLSEMTDHELKAMRKSEITQLKKRYPKRKDVSDSKFQFVFWPSDPDWPFDVKKINLELTFPELYPKHILDVSIYDEDSLPTTLARHIIKKVSDWLTDRHSVCQKQNKAELVFRPFLKWLDKTAEQLFTDGLTMYKKELAAKAAGFTFVHHKELQAAVVTSDEPADATEEGAAEYGSDVEISRAMAQSDLDHSDREDEESIPVQDTKSTAKSQQSMPSGRLSPARRGTELRLRNLRLTEAAATLHCAILRTGIRCSRCKTVHHVTMHPEKTYVVVCDKCRSKMSLVYHPNLMHMSSSTVGFFDLDGCQPFDLILQDCQFVAGCLECSKEQLVHGLHADQEKTFWCISCHKKICLAVERGSYILLNEGAAIKLGADAVVIAKKTKAKSELRILSDGKELPNRGACDHYKKSYRWFRFPCCGKLYPCDKCHDEKETDHEMEMANRMICGYCSKEQGFSLTKPCISCDSSMTRAKSQHWEGGQGCRNKIHMAKGDKQKFAGSNKTVSKKADAIRKKTGKKTTHVRHAV